MSAERFVELGAVTHWLSGGTPSRAIERYWQGDIPWISASTLRNIEVEESDQCVTREAVAAGSKMAPLNSTLLLVRGSALHNEIRAGIVCGPVCFNQDVKALVPAKEIYPKFLTYAILGRDAELLKLVSSAGNTAGVLDTKLVQSFQIWLPGMDEQKAISDALSDVDALLQELDRLIAKKRDIKQATMQQLLTGQTRLPGFNGEWRTVRLSNLAELYQPETISANEFTESGYPVYGANGIVGFYPLANHCSWQVIVTCRGSTCGTVNRTVEQCWITGNAMVINCDRNESVDKGFLYYLLLQKDFSTCISGTGQPQIVRSPLSALPIRLPVDKEEQSAIARVLSDFTGEVESLEDRRGKVVAIKRAMMQELLSGKTRLV